MRREILLSICLQEMRLRQASKNIFILAAPIFAGKFLLAFVLAKVLLTFMAFTCAASAVYFFNDIIDAEKDRHHPKKKFRPIASGRLPMHLAKVFMLGLIFVALLLAYGVSMKLLWLLCSYLVMNLAYTLYFKRVVIVDVIIIAIGFVMRAFAGVFAANVQATTWFILCVFMLSLFLALSKRRAELCLLENYTIQDTRQVLSKYTAKLLDQFITMVGTMTIMTYALFTQSALPLEQGIPLLSLTVPFVLYAVFRYLYLMYVCGKGEQPEEILLKDKPILCTVLIFGLCILCLRDL